MIRNILRLRLLKKVPYFKKEENQSFLNPYADLFSFLIEVIMIAGVFTVLEKGINIFIDETIPNIFALLMNSVYFVMTTATTVGYGDVLPTNLMSKFFVIIAIYIYLSARLLRILSGFIEAKSKKEELKKIGRLFVMMKDHIIVYCDANTIKRDNFLWLKRFVKENKESTKFKENRILLVNHNEDATQMLNEAMLANNNFDDRVLHININIDEGDFFKKISIEDATQVYILGNSEDTHSDSKVFDFAYRVEAETKYIKDVTAEIINDANRKRMYAVGVDVIMRPNRSYPEMLVTATIAPGTASVLEELSSRGNDTLEVFNIPNTTKSFIWSELLIPLSINGIGTVIGVVYKDYVDINPMGKDRIENGLKIVMMIHEMRDKSYENIQQEIDAIFKEI